MAEEVGRAVAEMAIPAAVILIAVEGPLEGSTMVSKHAGDRRPVWYAPPPGKVPVVEGRREYRVVRSAKWEQLPDDMRNQVVGCYVESIQEPGKLLWLKWDRSYGTRR